MPSPVCLYDSWATCSKGHLIPVIKVCIFVIAAPCCEVVHHFIYNCSDSVCQGVEIISGKTLVKCILLNITVIKNDFVVFQGKWQKWL